MFVCLFVCFLFVVHSLFNTYHAYLPTYLPTYLSAKTTAAAVQINSNQKLTHHHAHHHQTGKPFTIEWLKLEEAEADVHNAKDLASAVDLHAASPEQVQAFLGVALKSILIGMHRGAYDVTDEWNRLLPEYQFTRVEDFVKKVWGCKQVVYNA